MNENQLPEAFLRKMKELLGEEEYRAYLTSFEEKPFHGLRVNTRKISPEALVKAGVFKLEPVPWAKNGFYYEEEARPAKDPYYYGGLYYIQEPSAMAPASLLPVRPGDKVLDLCAAPGGKSTELALKLEGKGLLLSNDISVSRARACLKNLELWGMENICVTGEEPWRLRQAFGEFFDKILVDAPCSGEGMFRRDKEMVKCYEGKGPEAYVPVQKEIIRQAVGMLAPGGLLLYSTCTFSVLENEEMVRWVLEEFQEMELVKLPLASFGEGAKPGIGLEGCVRLFPHLVKGEGHFAGLLRKKGRAVAGSKALDDKVSVGKTAGKGDGLPESFWEFMKMVSRELNLERVFVKNEMVFYLPEGFRTFPEGAGRLRYLRTGLLLGEVKKGRFEPAQALAMCLRKDEFSQV